jgi:Zn-dependent protease
LLFRGRLIFALALRNLAFALLNLVTFLHLDRIQILGLRIKLG